MESKGLEPDPEKIPVDYYDLPYDAQLAVSIYNKLGNRIYPDIGFIGKDYTILPILIEYYRIIDLELLLDMLNTLDADNIDKSQKAIKKVVDDAKKK